MEATLAVVFDTAIGAVGLLQSALGLKRVALGGGLGDVAARLRRVAPEAEPAEPSGPLADLAARLAAHAEGRLQDFGDVELDGRGLGAFEGRVYGALRRVPAGATTTYGALAAEAGDRRASRAVGVAMARNPWPIVVPCHRVLAAGGRIGGFSAPGGAQTKARLLTIERANAAGALFDDLAVAVRPVRGGP